MVRLVLAAAVALTSGGTAVRSLYLNGTDISSARSQELKGVDVMINEKGDVFIVAPHYQVNEEDTYVPLSKFVQGMGGPKHQPMQKAKPVPAEPNVKPMAKDEAPPSEVPTIIPKAGTPATVHPALQAADAETPKAEPVKAPAIEDGPGGATQK